MCDGLDLIKIQSLDFIFDRALDFARALAWDPARHFWRSVVCVTWPVEVEVTTLRVEGLLVVDARVLVALDTACVLVGVVARDVEESVSESSKKMSFCAPGANPAIMLYAGVPGCPGAPTVGALLPDAWLNTIICLAPGVHFDGSSLQYTAGLAGASFLVDLEPVTMHLCPWKYMLAVPHARGTHPYCSVKVDVWTNQVHDIMILAERIKKIAYPNTDASSRWAWG